MNFWGAGLLAVVLAIQEKPIITGDCSDENFNRLAISHGLYLKSLWASTEIKTGQDLATLIRGRRQNPPPALWVHEAMPRKKREAMTFEHRSKTVVNGVNK